MSWAAPFPQFHATDDQARLKRLRRLAWMIDGAFGLTVTVNDAPAALQKPEAGSCTRAPTGALRAL